MLEVGAKIRKLREERGLSLADVSEKTGLNPGTLSRLESGKVANPGVLTLMSIAEALGVSVLAFLDDEEHKRAMFEIVKAKYGDLISSFTNPDERIAIAVA